MGCMIFFFFQAEDGIRDDLVTGVQTCALPILFGLLHPKNEGLIPYITRMYAKRSRKAGGIIHTFEVAEGFKATFCRNCPLHFVGVWDTVSSWGWIWDPLKLPYTAQNPDIAVSHHPLPTV